MDSRQNALSSWCTEQLGTQHSPLEMVSGDASFRRYFRVTNVSPTLIAMDAPPEKEDSHSFVAIAKHWQNQGIAVPKVLHHDLSKGFLLLEDYGDQVLLNQLNANAPDIVQGSLFYPKAIQSLINIQLAREDQRYPLPQYDAELLNREMALFKDWLLGRKLKLSLNTNEEQIIADFFTLLSDSALSQPQVPVHRDYHSRNLMILPDDGLGILDFQDAVTGPITYDLVSLLRDCYIVWPTDNVYAWCQHYFQLAQQTGVLSEPLTTDFEQFIKWFDLMGMQRHLKAAGIFARLSLRDGKHGYLDDIPRTLDYLYQVSSRYAESQAFHRWLGERVLPALATLKSMTSCQ